MRVLLIAERFLPSIGGVEVLHAHLLRGLARRGHQLVHATGQIEVELPEDGEFEGTPVHRFPFAQSLLRHDLRRVREAADRLAALRRSFRPDVVHLSTSWGATLYFHARTRGAHPAPTLLTAHWTLERPPEPDGLVRQNLGAADAVVACSDAVRRSLLRHLPELAARSSVVHNGLEMPAAAPSPPAFDPPLLVCAGRLDRLKGFDLAIAALALLLPRFPRARLLLAGDLGVRPALEAQARDLGVAGAVGFLGWVAPEDIPGLFDRASVVLMPSRAEPFGLVALQAQQMARPVVAARTGGLPEVVRHGETGLLVEPENAPALAEAVAFLLAHPRQAAQMGRAGRERARLMFSLDRCVGAYEDLYRRLAAATA